MLRELNVVEQRYQAVLQVLDGIPVTEVAERFGVARQTVHRYDAQSPCSGSMRCPHQTHSTDFPVGGWTGMRYRVPIRRGRLPWKKKP
jgi:hypothetical protein